MSNIFEQLLEFTWYLTNVFNFIKAVSHGIEYSYQAEDLR